MRIQRSGPKSGATLLLLLCACGDRGAAPVAAPQSSASAVAVSPSASDTPPDCGALDKMRQGNIPSSFAGDPGLFWSTIEACGAPPHATMCERAWVGLLAVPSMANPTEAQLAEQKKSYLRACETLPVDVQRCLTAYGISHDAECAPKDAPEQVRQAQRRQP